MESPRSDADPCAICLADITRGQAIFTAECSHTFHLRCISDSVASGHRVCPLCKATWSDVPAVDPVPAPAPAPAPAPSQPASPPAPPRMYADDEPLAEGVVHAQGAGSGATADPGPAVLKAHCERPAVARGESRDGFAVLVHARAPCAAAAADDEGPRAPLDLVTVLDVSGSMDGDKLELLKQAMGFVIDNLGPADRLSVVSFSNDASRVLRLARMTDDGKAVAKRAVASLDSDGGTNIGDGLRMAAQVLADRRHRNAVTSVMLLSDGEDTYVAPGRRRNNGARYIDLVPSSFRSSGTRPAPIHTFGFGTDHDAAAMHTIAEATRGTFCFIKDQEVIQDAFAQCIGGLLSVAMQNARIHVACVHPGVRVREVKSGRYESRVDADGRAATVDVGELYAEEERRFLVFVDVQRAEAAEETTQLIKVRCTYRDTVTGQAADVAGEDAVVQRPVEVPDGDAELSMEVERERVRVAATEDMAAARAAAERGAHAEAAGILDRRREAVGLSAPALAGDPACAALLDELRELRAGVADRDEYEEFGRALVLEGMGSHMLQRASLRISFESEDSETEDSDEDEEADCDEGDDGHENDEMQDFCADEECEIEYESHRLGPRRERKRQSQRDRQPFQTRAMRRMVKKSRKLRRRQTSSASAPPPAKRTRGS
ncbi:hypothetical protein ACP70R_019225 [Stipagrostis hirtigluma subsp. patula]